VLVDTDGELAAWRIGRFAAEPMYSFDRLVRDASFSPDNHTMTLTSSLAKGASNEGYDITIADLIDGRWQTTATHGRHARVSTAGSDVAIAGGQGIYLNRRGPTDGAWTYVAERPRHGWIGVRTRGNATEVIRLRDGQTLASVQGRVMPTQDGRFLVGDDTKERLHVVDLDTGSVGSTPRVMSAGLLQTAWCSGPQHCVIVLANEDAARLYDTARNTEVLDLGGPDRYSFSPDGQYLVTVRGIWYLPTKEQVASVPGNSLFIAFGANAASVLAASGPSIYLTQWRPRDLLESACHLARNNRQDSIWAELVTDKMLVTACGQ
jgi:hypothetical protein